MKRGDQTITATELMGLVLLGILLVVIIPSVTTGCNFYLSSPDKLQAQGTLDQLGNFLDSIKLNEQNSFLIYSPRGFYMNSYFSGEQLQCTKNCICLCKDSQCLSKDSYCKDIDKPLKSKLLPKTQVGLGSLLITNNANNYDMLFAQYDTSNDQVTAVDSNCSGDLVTLSGNFLIRQSVKPAFDEAQKYAKSLGYDLIITSAYRTPDYQQQLLSKLGSDTACTPRDVLGGFGFNCPHVIGCAIDVHLNSTLTLPKETQNADTMIIRQIMEHAGFKGYPLSSKKFEFWHFNYGISTSA